MIQLDGGKQEGVSPDHSSSKTVNSRQDQKLSPAHVSVSLLLHHPFCREYLACYQGRSYADQTDPEPGRVSGYKEGVGGNDVKDNITEVRGKGDNIEQNITYW